MPENTACPGNFTSTQLRVTVMVAAPLTCPTFQNMEFTIPFDGTRGSGWSDGVGVGVEATGQGDFDIYLQLDRGSCSGSNSGRGIIQSCADFLATIFLGGYPIECCQGGIGSETSFSLTVSSAAPIPSQTPPPEKPLPCPPPPLQGGPTCSGGSCSEGFGSGPMGRVLPTGPHAAASGGGGGSQISLYPIRYSSGAVELSAGDLQTDGFGIPWGHTRRFLNLLQIPQTIGNGMNWTVDEWPFLVIQKSFDPDVESVYAKATPGGAWWFDNTSGDYEPRYGERVSFELDSQASVYKLTELNGTVTEFHQQTGMFRKRYDTAGNSVEVTQIADNNYGIAEVERQLTLGGDTITEQYQYSYSSPTGNAQLTEVLVRRRVNQGTWENVLRATYTYYGPSDSFGSDGDLQTATTEVWEDSSWTSTGTTLYRYYTDPVILSGSLPQPEFPEHLLKYAVLPDAYRQLADDPNVSDPLTAGNSIVEQYADYHFEYDSERRVNHEAVFGGSREFDFTFTLSQNSDGYNSWKTKTVEVQPDGSERIIYSNFAGQTMLSVLKSGSDQWVEFLKYDSDGQQILHAEASAVTGYDDQYADLLNESGGEYQYLRDNEGLIKIYGYHGPSGYLASESLQHGQLGAEIKLREFDYEACPNDSSIFFPSEERVYPSEIDQQQTLVTKFDHTFHGGTCQIEQRTTTLPAVPTSQNGSGTSATRKEVFDLQGNRTWIMDERGFISRTEYDPVTGGIVRRVEDVDTSVESGVPSGWSTPSGGGRNLVTDYQLNDLGQTIQQLRPEHTIDLQGSPTQVRSAEWIVHDYANLQVRTGRGYATGSQWDQFTLINPVSIHVTDHRGQALEEIEAIRSSTSGKLEPADSFDQSSYTRWTTHQYTDCCLLSATRVYHAIPTSGEGTEGTNYNETQFGYNSMKRPNRTVSPGGTITFSVLDVRSQVVETYVGTDDAGATPTDPTGGGLDPNNNMVLVTANQYDHGQDGGDGNLTQVTDHVDGSTTRVTKYVYDWRNRQTDVEGEEDHYEVMTHDNLDRVVRVEQRDGSDTGQLVARRDTDFDDRGRAYRTLQWEVDPDTGTLGNSLESNSWFDAAGNLVKSLEAGSRQFTKTMFDSLNRATHVYRGFGEDATYSDVFSVSGNVIMEETGTTYDDAGNAIQTTHRQRYHDAPAGQTGPLGSPSVTPKARITYSAAYPDALGRTMALADYGTHGGSAFTRSATIPARSDTVLVSSTGYNQRGEPFQSIDPAGKEDRTTFDDAARRIELIENYVDPPSSPGSGNGCAPSDDENVTVQFTYTPDGDIHKQIVPNAETGNQETEYVYGTTLDSSEIASSRLLHEVIYPDSTSGTDRVKHRYNRQGQVIKTTDQNQTEHAFDYDLLGRQTQDRVVTLGSGVDGAVRRIELAYNKRGDVERITSFDSATAGSGNVVNEVFVLYNGFGQAIETFQSHAGAVNLSTTPSVQMAYADGSANTIRPTGITYPDGRKILFGYGAADSIHDQCSLVSSLIDSDTGETHLADYQYLGLGAVVLQDSPQADLRYTLVSLTGSNDPDTGDIYSGLDRFGRVKDLRWRNTDTSSDLSRVLYGYDRASSRIWRENPSDSSRRYDWLYGYDGLHRLHSAERGELNSGHTSITSPQFGQCWTLDPTGNWQGFRQDDDGNSTWDLIQARTSNPVNEITDIDNTTGPSWATPSYDASGNMTTIPRPDLGTDKAMTATWDAWNRLVKLVDPDTSDTVAEFAYDGRNFRVVGKSFAGGTLDETRHYYFTDSWQCLEERLDSSSDPERQHVWGIRYIDDLVLRDRDTTGNGTLDERLYFLPDANWNVTAVVDDSGAVEERIEYTPYGWPQFLSPTFGARSASSFDVRYTYTSREWERAVGLFYFRNRWYDGGSFSSRDPAEYLSGINLYVATFVLNNTDPSGKQPDPWSSPWYDGHYGIPTYHPPAPPPLDRPKDTGALPPGTAIGWDLGYGHFCGPTRVADCDATDKPAMPPDNPTPIDAIDRACMAHDCCLRTWREWFNPCRQIACNVAFCNSAKIALIRDCNNSPAPRQCRAYANMILQSPFCNLALGRPFWERYP